MSHGFATSEALLSVALLAAVSLALSDTLIGAARARTRIERSSIALRLAEAGLERVRATGRDACDVANSDYHCTSVVTWWNEELRIDHARVVVESKDDPDLVVSLETLVRR